MTPSRTAKRVVQRLVRRVNGPAEDQLHAQAELLAHHDRAIGDLFPALQALQAAHSDLQLELVKVQQRTDLLETHLPELLAICSSSAGAQRRMQRQIDSLTALAGVDGVRAQTLEQHATSIRELWGRIEFIRREVMNELRYSGGSSAAVEKIEVRVVDQARVDELSGTDGPRLNLGCGHIALDGYVNVDMRELPGVDVVAPVDELPFEQGAVAEVFSAHVLEHFPQEQLRRLLPYWLGLLRPGGVLRAVVPDAVSMMRGFTADEVPFNDLREVLYGGQEYEGDFHFTAFSTDSLAALLEAAGFVDIEVEAEGRVNDICLELQIAGRRPG